MARWRRLNLASAGEGLRLATLAMDRLVLANVERESARPATTTAGVKALRTGLGFELSRPGDSTDQGGRGNFAGCGHGH